MNNSMIDARIPLQAQAPQIMSPMDLEGLKQMMYRGQLQEMQMAEAQRQTSSKNAMREIFSQPGAMGPQGDISPEAMSRLAAVDPEAAMKFGNSMAMQTYRRAQMERAEEDMRRSKEDSQRKERAEAFQTLIPLGSELVRRYKAEHAQNGAEATIQALTKYRNEEVDNLVASGQLPEKYAEQAKAQPFNPFYVERQLRMAKGGSSGAETSDKRYERDAKGDWLEYKVKVDPVTGQESKVTGSERPLFAKQVPAIVQTGGQTGEQTKGWQIFQDPKTGKLTRVNAITGERREFTGDTAGLARPAGQSSNIEERWNDWTEQEKDEFARQAMNDRSMLVGFGRGAQGPKVLLDVNRRMIQLQQKEGGAGASQRRAEFRADSNSLNKVTQTYDALTAFENTAIRNGEVLVDLAKKVDKTGIPAIERWIRAGRKELAGDPDVSEFNAQIMLFGTEAAKILTNPNMTGVLTDQARKEVLEFIPTKASAKQVERLVGRLKSDFENRKRATEQQMDAIRDRMVKGYGAGTKGGGRETGATPSGGDMKAQVEAAGWTYEPAKYDYRVVSGKVQRKAK